MQVKIKGDKETVYNIFWVNDDGIIELSTEKEGKYIHKDVTADYIEEIVKY